MGGILTAAFACQPKTPNVNSSSQPSENQADQDDDDGDDGAYGDGDTSSCCDHSCAEALHPEEIVFEMSEEELTSLVGEIEIAPAEKIASEELTAKLELPTGEVAILEPVSPVEIVAEAQEPAQN